MDYFSRVVFFKLNVVGLLSCLLVNISMIHADDISSKKVDSKESKNKFIAGIYVGGSVMQISSNYYSNLIEIPGDFEKSIIGVSYGLKAGYDWYFLPKHGVRIYFDYMNSYFNSKERTLGTYVMHTIALNADYRFDIFDNFGVFAGVGGAFNIINTQYLGNMSAFAGSINGGLVYSISFVEFEFRIRYLAYEIPEKSSNYLPPIDSHQPTRHLVELDSPISFHVGANIKF